MTVEPEILVGVGTAIAVLGIGIWKNRSDIRRLDDVLFGYEGDSGHSDELERIDEHLTDIETKIDRFDDSRVQAHKSMEAEIKTNRYLITRGLQDVVTEINRNSDDFDLESPDLEPDHFEFTDDKWSDDSE